MTALAPAPIDNWGARHDSFLSSPVFSKKPGHPADHPRPNLTKRMKEGVPMGLEEKLAAVREGSAKRIPPESQAIMHNATEQLRSGMLDRVIKPGATAPDFTLDDQDGHAVTLSALLASGPVVMSVFRGFW
jgi:hypothetical protein